MQYSKDVVTFDVPRVIPNFIAKGRSAAITEPVTARHPVRDGRSARVVIETRDRAAGALVNKAARWARRLRRLDIDTHLPEQRW